MMARHPLLHFVLLAGLATVPSCVVPVSPEWHDPQSNYPPTIDRATPPLGSLLGFDPDGGASSLTVEVVLADQDTQDRLYARWIIDYPPFVDGVSHMAVPTRQPGGDTIQRPAIRFAPSCSDDHLAHGLANHRLLLAVSDRPFASDDLSKDLVEDGQYLIEGSWQFEIDCE
jgi:hypothetical protein